MRDDGGRRRTERRWWIGAVVVVSAPLVVALVALALRPWVPVLDLAMTELRVRDVGTRHTPSIGLPGRIGELPDQGSHPGPWSFVLIAPWYRLAGATAWGMELGSVVINVVAVAGIVELGRRRHGPAGVVAYGLIAAIAVRGYGTGVLTHPWNPYFPVLLWLLAVLAAVHVVSGGVRWAPVVTAASVIAAQTHVPYLVSAVALDAVVLAALGRRWWRGDRRAGRWAIAAVGVAVALWVPPAIEQLRNGRDGNIARSVRHFATDQPDPSIGLIAAAERVTQHLDLFRISVGLLGSPTALVDRAGTGGWSVGGVVVLVAWAVAAVWARRRGHRPLLAAHLVALVLVLAGWVSISRIFGKVWFYLTLWMSAAAMLVALILLWTAVVAWRSRSQGASRAPVAVGAIAVVVLSTLSIVAAVGQDPPEEAFGEDVDAIVDDVVAGVAVSDTGLDGRYVVVWQESVVPGSQGYALLNELERRGLDVGVHPPFRVPATPHRVQVDPDAEIHLVSGAHLEEWRTRGYEEIVTHDGRTPEERRRAAELEASIDAALADLGRGDVAEIAAANLFRASLQPDLPRAVVDEMDELMRIGRPMAVFLAPPGSTY